MSENSTRYKLELNQMLQGRLRECMLDFLRHVYSKIGDGDRKWWLGNVVRKPLGGDRFKALEQKWEENGAQGTTIFGYMDTSDCLFILAYRDNVKNAFKNERISAYARQLIVERNESSHINDFECLDENQFKHAKMTIRLLEEALAEASGRGSKANERKFGEVAVKLGDEPLQNEASCGQPALHLERRTDAAPRIAEGNHMQVDGVEEEMFDRFGIDDRIDGMLAAGRPIYTHAVGGVGKTRVAQAYCASGHAEKYNYVFWVNASSDDIRADVMAEQVFRFNQMDEGQTDIDASFKEFVNQHKHLRGKVLLVVDGVELESQVESIERHLPKLGWDLLITTRSVKKDASFGKRVLKLEELEIEFCRDLFYEHFGEERRKPEDEQALDGLIEALSHNSHMIRLFAKQGHERDKSVSYLYEILKKADASDKIYRDFSKSTMELFNASELLPVEKTVLAYFTALPVRPVPETVLLKWFATDGVDLDEVFRALYKKGWLLYTISSDEVSFHCHSLIAAALKNQIGISEEELDRFIGNVADFFDHPPSERRDHMYLTKYFDFADAIIESCDNTRMAMLKLKLNYLDYINNFECNPPKSMVIATDVMENYKPIYDNDLSEESIALKYDVLHEYSYAFALSTGASFPNKREMHLQHLDELLKLSIEFFPENDLRTLRVKRRLAQTFRKENPEKALELQLEVLSAVEAKLQSDPDDRECKFFYIGCLRVIGITCNQIRPATIESRKKALGYYRKAFESSCRQYGNESYNLLADYNNVGVGLLGLYQLEPVKEYLDEAEQKLTKSYEMRLEYWSPESLSVAHAINHLSLLYRVKKDFKQSLALAEEGLRIRKAILKDDNPKIAPSLQRLAGTQLAIYKDNADVEMLRAAKTNAEEALRISSKDVSGSVSISGIKETLGEIDAAIANAGL